MPGESKKTKASHFEASVVDVANTIVLASDDLLDRKPKVWAKWKVVGDFNSKYTEYSLTVESKLKANPEISLYSLCLQGRTHDVYVKIDEGTDVKFFESEKLGGGEIEPLKSPPNLKGWFKIRKTNIRRGAKHIIRWAEEDSIFFMKVGTKKDSKTGRTFCKLSVQTRRHFHSYYAHNSVPKSGHDNLPPQPGSGGNQ